MLSERGFASQIYSSVEELRKLADDVHAGARYTVTRVKKRDGSLRQIYKPDPLLAMALKKANEFLTARPLPTIDHVYGFVRGRSIVDNARQHLSKPVVIRIDLKDFFESISTSRVILSLEQHLDFGPEAAQLAGRLLTVNGTTPVGFSTSPYLSNLVFRETDIAVASMALQNGLAFTRYVDDMNFSGIPKRTFIEDVTEVLSRFGWSVNKRKTQIMRRGGKQYVTGLSVSDPKRPRIPPNLKHRMRWKLHMIEKFGYEQYMTGFGGEDCNDHPRKLLGLARYIALVEPALGIDLLDRLNRQLDDSWYSEQEEDSWLGYR
ncbi:MAG TPA: reverse transcriptase family protein [Pyrinomonadaceae bacterium]